MNIIFLGTPEFAVSILDKLVNSRHKVVAVVSQPDKPVGRKQILEPTPTKTYALNKGIKVFQFAKIKKEGVEPLKELNADVMITVAYGQILSKELLELTKYGTINVHGSLLPKYRGAAPFQWSLINGEEKGGVTIMQSDVGIDDGPIYKMQEFDIGKDDTLDDLYKKASQVAPNLLLECLDSLEKGEAVFKKQNEKEMTYYPMLKTELSYLDFNKNKKDLVNLIRGISQWPTATCLLNGQRLNIYSAQEIEQDLPLENYQNGQVVESSGKKGIVIKVKDGFISLKEVQIQGGKRMDAKAFANGNKIKKDDILKKFEV
ncbi:MAG: methionyl-tRNA formyltransferase [Clostridia bacterium]|nr:methionyl-tRNA formyltransferase [Clostridia bacterium]